MNANQLKNILCSIKNEFGAETWDAALALLTVPAVEAPKKVVKKNAKKEVVEGAEKPKRVLTPEHKAAMQAGRQAAKAAKDAQELPGETIVTEKPKKVVAEGSEKPKRVLTPEHKAAMQAGRKKAKEAAAAAPQPKAAAPEPKAAAPAPKAAEEIKVAGKAYICLADGRCYEPGSIDGELGAWAGLFKNGVLDTTARED